MFYYWIWTWWLFCLCNIPIDSLQRRNIYILYDCMGKKYHIFSALKKLLGHVFELEQFIKRAKYLNRVFQSKLHSNLRKQ